MNPFEMVVLIVAIIAVAGVLRARATQHPDGPATATDTAEAERLRAEVRQLKERLHVLERIVTDGERDGSARLDREIEALRARDREMGA